MAKISQGRISGLHGMESHTSDDLFAWAESLRIQANDPNSKDDPKWLNRRADQLHSLAVKKEKAHEQKNQHAKS